MKTLLVLFAFLSHPAVETLGLRADLYPEALYSHSSHRLNSLMEDSIELEDGSIWKISQYDVTQVANWKKNSPLIITQNPRWFSEYKYRIIHAEDKTFAEANLSLGSFLGGKFSRFITEIDYVQKKLKLDDNSGWDLSDLDQTIFTNWTAREYVIIGTNSDISFWDSSQAILINVHMNNYIRATRALQ